MGRLNPQYGSELHLLRMLGRHRQYFNRLVLSTTAADGIEWLDFPSGDISLDKNGNSSWDREWQQLNFLANQPAKLAWTKAWPKRGPSWDAVGQLRYESGMEWLLVEAKANLEELNSNCQAQDDSLEKIRFTIEATKKALGVSSSRDWLSVYYQHCNRLTALHIMNSNGAPARLLYVYFIGDKGGAEDGWPRTCPSSKLEWDGALESQAEYIGLPANHNLEGRIHKLFVDARCLDA